MSAIQHIVAVTSMNLRSIPLRMGPSSVVVVGIAGVVGVLISYLAMVSGLTQTASFSGKPDRAIVFAGEAGTEAASNLPRNIANRLMDMPGVRRDTDGRSILSAEAVLKTRLVKKESDDEVSVTVRGVTEKAFALRPEMKLIEGRLFQTGVHELLVGKSAQLQFNGTQLGERITIRNTEWTVVGIFESGGDLHESELFADLDTLLSAYRRNVFQSATAQLESPTAFDSFKAALLSDPTLKVEVKRESEYYREQAEQMSKLLNFVAYVVGGIMTLGAVFGAINSMYVAVSTRTREIATLRAIGFDAAPVVISVFVEALLLALLGGAIGALSAWLMFDDNVASTISGSMSQLIFKITVTPQSIVIGISLACAIGLIGSIFPAVRAAKLPVAEALRAV